MSISTEIKTIPLSGTKNGLISISNITEPYGKGSDDVVSIGISLNGQDIEWKSHIPYANIDALIEALQEAKKLKN